MIKVSSTKKTELSTRYPANLVGSTRKIIGTVPVLDEDFLILIDCRTTVLDFLFPQRGLNLFFMHSCKKRSCQSASAKARAKKFGIKKTHLKATRGKSFPENDCCRKCQNGALTNGRLLARTLAKTIMSIRERQRREQENFRGLQRFTRKIARFLTSVYDPKVIQRR